MSENFDLDSSVLLFELCADDYLEKNNICYDFMVVIEM